ncbi:hypothetical protein P280DRAFT_522405 [Massarina eburnea CBS 473.64]|uniref:DUF7907 domain-containing protein n=1 Tax=Massarina eburnea CBS 473.64 TaxID=1395130 RepID=A0A6A6RM26_9PLEO|nr:hypothetical protein P280DRAFT_522405 [Massarina eburnea CBS 473.64]
MHFVYCLMFSLTAAHYLPPTSTSPNFRIAAAFNSDSPLSAIAQGWNLTTYHVDPGNNYVVLSNTSSRTFYNNGTADDFTSHTSQVWTDGGTPPWPQGVSVAPDKEARRGVYVTNGRATPGVEVAEWPATVYFGTGTWYVCNLTLTYGPAIALYWREKVDNTPEGCANVELQAWCLENGSGVEHPLARNSTCYQTTV